MHFSVSLSRLSPLTCKSSPERFVFQTVTNIWGWTALSLSLPLTHSLFLSPSLSFSVSFSYSLSHFPSGPLSLSIYYLRISVSLSIYYLPISVSLSLMGWWHSSLWGPVNERLSRLVLVWRQHAGISLTLSLSPFFCPSLPTHPFSNPMVPGLVHIAAHKPLPG